ncbi:MAG: ribonuclease III [Woeseiaceae bacterium]
MTLETAERWLYKTLNYRFDDSGLFRQALTHRSAAGANNERLEFLGDAILGFVISDAIYSARLNASEGDLSRLRSSLVKDSSLATLAADLGIGEHLILGSGESKSGGHRRESILADALEALFGAIFLDSGIESARDIIQQVFDARIDSLPDAADLRDPKTRLQEWLQARGMALPIYDLVKVMGEAHSQRFEVTCTVEVIEDVTLGTSTTRRKAEQKAAREMLSILQQGRA